MKTLKNKTMTIAISIILLLAMLGSLFATPTVKAHTPPETLTTWTYAYATNTVIGVGQQDTIVFWSDAIPPTALGAYGDRWTFYVNITTPSGAVTKLGPITSDPVGGGYAYYTPTAVGNYTVVASMMTHVMTGLPLDPNPFGGQSLTSVGDTYLGSSSLPFTITVQSTPISGWTEAPLPTAYWTFPINQANRGWYVLAGNWLAGAAQTVGASTRYAYGEGPETAHVLWTKPAWAGGISDTRLGDNSYNSGGYEDLNLAPPIILNGYLYYNCPNPMTQEGWYCVNLYTGQTQYFFNTTGPVVGVSPSSTGSIAQQSLAFGQVLNIENPNQHGTFPYLWSTTAAQPATWMMYDAFTGNYICSIDNVPTVFDGVTWGSLPAFLGIPSIGVMVYGSDGSILLYNIINLGTFAHPNDYLQCWNTTQAIWWEGTSAMYQAGDYSAFSSNNYWLWRPGLSVTYNGNNAYSLNASIPAVQGNILMIQPDQYVIGGTAGKNNGTYIMPGNLWALNLAPNAQGKVVPTLLWNITFTPPVQGGSDLSAAAGGGVLTLGPGLVTLGIIDPQDGVFEMEEKATLQRWGYSLKTGQLLWGPSAPEPELNYYSSVAPSTGLGIEDYYEGMLISTGFSGVTIAYNITTGHILWNFTAPQIGFESPYGNSPTGITAVGDGQIYLVGGEHSATSPIARDFYLWDLNATNGALLWKLLFFGTDGGANLAGYNVVMGDGDVVGLNDFDAQIYCIGMGPSATTVTAPDTGIPIGSSLLISGTVMDTSAGTKQLEQAADYPNGVPCVSDASQEGFMEHVYEQQPMPTSVTGVPVTITAIDPNGNFIQLGKTTSDASGFYSLTVNTNTLAAGPGTYKVTANFPGSLSYYGSSAETAFVVTAAPATPAPTAAPVTGIASTGTVELGVAAIIIVIVVCVAVLAVLTVRKRP